MTVVWSIKAPFRGLFALMELMWLQGESDGEKKTPRNKTLTLTGAQMNQGYIRTIKTR